MNDFLIARKYQVQSTILTNASVNIFVGITNTKDHFRIHQIKDKTLIKYYLQHIDHFKPTLPFEESFVINSDLYLVFKDYSQYSIISNPKYNDYDRKNIILSLLAKFALDDFLPNFFKYTLLKSENLMIDSNSNLCFNCTLNLLNPDSMNDFKSVQKKVSTLIDTLVTDDEILDEYVQKCEKGQFNNSMDMFKEYKRIISEQYEYKEPWIYEKMHDIVLFIVVHFKHLVFIGIFLILVAYGFSMLFSSAAAMEEPYVKSNIGVVTYPDPYSDHPPELEFVSVYIPQMETPPISVESQEQLTNDYSIYIVPPGDYLYKISTNVYGDPKYAKTIALFNKLENPDFIPVNYPLKLPTLENIEHLYELLNEKTTD